MDYLQYSYKIVLNIITKFVLNLIINGLPSIQKAIIDNMQSTKVLNLIINGLPSILCKCAITITLSSFAVLNLIINGLPSIQDLKKDHMVR